jgi:hypothetical protein
MTPQGNPASIFYGSLQWPWCLRRPSTLPGGVLNPQIVASTPHLPIRLSTAPLFWSRGPEVIHVNE